MTKVFDRLAGQDIAAAVAWIKLASFFYLSFYVILPVTEWAWAKTQPATTWLQYNSISIPEFHAGDNPRVVANRFIKRNLEGRWYARVYDYENGDMICEGRGESHYRPTLTYPPKLLFVTSLNDYTGDERCSRKLYPGRFYMDVSFIWTEFGATKTLSVKSEPFTVEPKP
jgi:hypothetical protein